VLKTTKEYLEICFYKTSTSHRIVAKVKAFKQKQNRRHEIIDNVFLQQFRQNCFTFFIFRVSKLKKEKTPEATEWLVVTLLQVSLLVNTFCQS